MTMTTEAKVLTENPAVLKWVEEITNLCKPEAVRWCDGSEGEKAELTAISLKSGELEELDQNKLPGCYLHRSDPKDVARVEGRTFICTETEDQAGPTNNWMAPAEAYQTLSKLFEGSMKGRTMYVVPFIMGPANSPFSKVGIQITDSIYVVLNMRIMTRMGAVAWKQLGKDGDFTRCLHSVAKLDPEGRYICHFPQDNTIWSINSGYGGNALLGKKCLALRIASYLGRKEGWMAEHMLILGIENPKGEKKYVAAAFPSQCGKTNLAMLIPPKALAEKGWKVTTVGDDIAWLRIGEDGRLWATNPENGFFGVAPGTNKDSNPNALDSVMKDTIFTNVVKTPENTVWWEGLENPPKKGTDWLGNDWKFEGTTKGAHPNSRFTAPIKNCPSLDEAWEDPKGVPLDAIFFGGRRAKAAPLIFESFDWEHGTFVGSQVASEKTAAAEGKVGEVRRDPMAMLPFIGYHAGEYLEHWLAMGVKLGDKAPKIFHVNWFRRDKDGKFMWPGFGENLRALIWALERCEGKGKALKTPIGNVPAASGLDTEGLDLDKDTLQELLAVNQQIWIEEWDLMKAWYEKGKVPQKMWDQLEALKGRLEA